MKVQVRLARGARVANLSQYVTLFHTCTRRHHDATLLQVGENDLGPSASEDDMVPSWTALVAFWRVVVQ
jgi:hypothetical protein